MRSARSRCRPQRQRARKGAAVSLRWGKLKAVLAVDQLVVPHAVVRVAYDQFAAASVVGAGLRARCDRVDRQMSQRPGPPSRRDARQGISAGTLDSS